MSTEDTEYLTMRQAVDYLSDEHDLSLSYYDLSRLNSLQAGPTFTRMANSPMYKPSDLDAWAATRNGTDDDRTDGTRASA